MSQSNVNSKNVNFEMFWVLTSLSEVDVSEPDNVRNVTHCSDVAKADYYYQ